MCGDVDLVAKNLIIHNLTSVLSTSQRNLLFSLHTNH